ncbi:hypothetical protein K0M31_005012 [Melipona bicolor]|uniref:Uncharacterized protein n=1 Tax=Melipona bicolor TaxID=60889 RepID=A0AA40FWJ6_9HYME|nr:hypothetical protein K0M31_005012 [Melipona bicolor]
MKPGERAADEKQENEERKEWNKDDSDARTYARNQAARLRPAVEERQTNTARGKVTHR